MRIYMFTCIKFICCAYTCVCVYVHVGIAIHCLSEGDEKVQYYTYTIIIYIDIYRYVCKYIHTLITFMLQDSYAHHV